MTYQKTTRKLEEDKVQEEDHGQSNEETTEIFEQLPKTIKVQTGSESLSIYHKQKFPAILDTYCFKKDKQPDKYYFSRLLLFHPWRNESDFETDSKDLYEQNKEPIEENAKKHLLHADEVIAAEERLHEEGLDDGFMDAIAPGIAADNAEANEEGQELVTGVNGADEDQDPIEKTEKTTVTSNTLNDLYKKEAEKIC